MNRHQVHTQRPGCKAFTFAELIVVVSILVVLIGIMVPYIAKVRESDRRYRCLDNLGQLYGALNAYSRSNNGAYPRTPDDPSKAGYTCFSGANDLNPFSPHSAVARGDVTASLWLLVRGRLCSPGAFICPSTSCVADDATFTERSNFRSAACLSYSYACPFGRTSDYKLNDTQHAGFALMADMNPGSSAFPNVHDDALAQAAGNSFNHRRAGQNVLYADGHVAFQSTPYCGVDRDNIYTALVPPITQHSATGVQSHAVGPAWESDSDLVPTAMDVR